ncbi:nitrate/nitrite transport system ATP-binding protein [Roseimicrobium gellanilyticum]|uniref:Nitrate/nitrite transport system ATP-binding protein n=1 Tax=Roseimicrobium gellanilyticum TaxID=748857 RepID=A0A366HTM7_9BACT|nr:ABC transporter ATP-binding protein [Roseimicrobium gellanilyticum]RBP47643.1 nitrate/nitrite transport system ATP-binding protein [Roseimicrobium gellanilyticum]
MPLIELKGVNKGYGSNGSRNEVLKGIDLSVEEGEFVVIVGYSGSGKTTLMNMISGLAKPDKGEALIEGKPITGPGPDRSLVFQNYSLLPWLNVTENIELAVDAVFPDWSKEKKREHVEKHIAMVKLSHAKGRFPKELSGGMRQRVSVARALAMDSRVLLLDEPLSALDALTRATLQDDISDIWQRQRKTVIWITNDPDEAILLADRVIPLLPTAPATLGQSLKVDLERPRDRKAVNHDPKFKALRNELINLLLEAKGKQRATVSKKLVLPDILPEDLNTVNSLQFINRRGPRRRNEEKRETIEVLP